MRPPSPLIGVILGCALLALLAWRCGPPTILKSIADVGWGVILVIALGGVSHLVKTHAWRFTLLDDNHKASFLRMFGLRLSSEAVGQLGFFGQLLGDTLRASFLSSEMSIASKISSVTLDRSLFVFSAVAVTTAGVLVAPAVLQMPRMLSLSGQVFAIALLTFMFFTALAVENRWRVLSGGVRILSRVKSLSEWVEAKGCLIRSVENILLDFYHNDPHVFWKSFGLNFACHCLAVLEVFLILWFMSAKINFFAAVAIEALTKLVNVLGTFNPGNFGTYEGANMLAARLLGLSGAAGLTLALTRRVRAIFWTAVGCLCLIVLSGSKKRGGARTSTARRSGGPDGCSTLAVILADSFYVDCNFWPRLPQVGGLPILLRAILGVRKAGAGRVVVVVNQITGPAVKRQLMSTGRLRESSAEWYSLQSRALALPALLKQFLGDAERVLLVAGDRTYHPALLRRAAEWSGARDALALLTESQRVGIYALNRDTTVDLTMNNESRISSVEELHAWLTSTHAVECEDVPKESWQCVHTLQDRLSAEQKLDEWLVKPTDGFFAKMNRRLSIPISRQLIKFPITPNMVSLFTLGISFMAGVLFSFGGYRSMLLGALISLFASILDGCDGEVARLKLQESDFGCWLETICDYLYYLFIFTGMTIGLWRSSGTWTFLVWGGLLLFGAIASFLVTGLQRYRLAAGRPEQLLAMWHAQADTRRSNPLFYIGRKTEFMVRRCFLPYAILFFALFNITNIAFILSAFGANIVWLIALYSHRVFVAVPETPAMPSCVDIRSS